MVNARAKRRSCPECPYKVEGDEEAVLVRRLIPKTIVASLAILSVLTACGSEGIDTTSNTPEPSVTTTSDADTTTPEAPATTRALAAVPETTRATTAPTSPPVTQSTAYFANCTDARAAGAAPLRRGDPGYRSALDRDGDGVACET